jgi:hypothetical protein
VELPIGSYQVGTGRAADIQLRDKGVGFKHAQLDVRQGGVWVKDHKSRGGTFVGGDKIEANVEVQLTDGVAFRIGTTELSIEGAGAGTAEVIGTPVDEPSVDVPEKAEPEPVIADPEPEPVIADPEPEPVVADPEPEPVVADPEPEPVVADPEPVAAAPTEPGPEDEPLSSDVNLLQQQVLDLRRKLGAKTQEADALTQALEGAGGTGGGGGMDAMGAMGGAMGGALGGYGDTIDDEYKNQILDLQATVQVESAKVFEREESIRALEGRIGTVKGKHQDEVKRLTAAGASTDHGLQRAYTELEQLKDQLAKSKDLDELEEANANLLDDNETLRDELDGANFKAEEEHSARASIVRDRVTELRNETQRMEDSNAEMRTLVEAYEEKIDELDERVEELEGENEALETLVGDLRMDLAKVKKERETMVKTLRKKLKASEARVEEVRAAKARASAEHKQAV